MQQYPLDYFRRVTIEQGRPAQTYRPPSGSNSFSSCPPCSVLYHRRVLTMAVQNLVLPYQGTVALNVSPPDSSLHHAVCLRWSPNRLALKALPFPTKILREHDPIPISLTLRSLMRLDRVVSCEVFARSKRGRCQVILSRLPNTG